MRYKRGARAAPKRWPVDLCYIRSLRYHSSVSADVLSFIQPAHKGTCVSNNAVSETMLQPCYDALVIQLIDNLHHPAHGQCGLFATKKISVRVFLLDYLGEVHCDDRPNSDYDVSLQRLEDGTSVGIDAECMGNEARFINDYRGVQSRPNAEFRERRTEIGELRMSLWSTQRIPKGEEILVSYGKPWWKARTDTN